jgi:hypothetical protein
VGVACVLLGAIVTMILGNSRWGIYFLLLGVVGIFGMWRRWRQFAKPS